MSNKQIDITKEVMAKIDKGEVKMKPRWQFLAVGLVVILGIVGLSMLSAFLISLVSFFLRTHGPLVAERYQELLGGFPWWAIVLVVLSLVGGILLLKRYDFSYRKNFLVIVFAFVVAVLISGWLADRLGLEKVWSKEGQVQKLYQQYDGRGKMYLQNIDREVSPGRKNGQMRKNGYN